jgi:hypothetical protein
MQAIGLTRLIEIKESIFTIKVPLNKVCDSVHMSTIESDMIFSKFYRSGTDENGREYRTAESYCLVCMCTLKYKERRVKS